MTEEIDEIVAIVEVVEGIQYQYRSGWLLMLAGIDRAAAEQEYGCVGDIVPSRRHLFERRRESRGRESPTAMLITSRQSSALRQ
jgi:hypothetical protein